jgi:hypothetical protein
MNAVSLPGLTHGVAPPSGYPQAPKQRDGLSIMSILPIAIMVACVAASCAATACDYSREGLLLAQFSSIRDDRRTMVCTHQYSPVCGRLNGSTTTYPNRCFARVAGAEVIADGPCGPEIDRPLQL